MDTFLTEANEQLKSALKHDAVNDLYEVKLSVYQIESKINQGTLRKPTPQNTLAQKEISQESTRKSRRIRKKPAYQNKADGVQKKPLKPTTIVLDTSENLPSKEAA